MSFIRAVSRALTRHGCTPGAGVRQQRLALAAAEAFAQRRFTLRHEPIMHINSGRALYRETLCSLRTNSKPLRIDRALKALEVWGASLPVNLFIMQEALAQRQVKPALGRIGINLPPNLLKNAAARQRIATLLHRYRIQGRLNHVVIELVETHPLSINKPVLNWLHALRAHGALIALDDYAAPKGFHTPTHAALDVIDIIKIDGAITAKLLAGHVPSWWQAFIIQAQAQGKIVVAEHATTVAEAKALLAYGISHVQSRHLRPTMFKR